MPNEIKEKIRYYQRAIRMFAFNKTIILPDTVAPSALKFYERKQYIYAKHKIGELAYNIFELASRSEIGDQKTAIDYFLISFKAGNNKSYQALTDRFKRVDHEHSKTQLVSGNDLFRTAIAAFLDQQYSEGYALLKLAAGEQDRDAMAALSLEKPIVETLKVLKTGASYTQLGDFYGQKAGRELVGSDYSDAMSYYNLAASEGDVNALDRLLKSNPTPGAAREYVELLAIQGHPVTSNILARLIEFRSNRLTLICCAMKHR